ncbi:hypothetical protein [Priestia megaterium]|uniref:hypothetical protein n=1 Tax=Priestia megaterium TaxID=1404 RepID=UPI000762504C|nr:hypothetical protein [Priestia megaterium]KWU59138.1 hypothetical protein AWX17_21890 [Priestia megaterium]
MKILINYANDKYKKTQKFNSFTGKHIGKFDKIYSYSPDDIDYEFREKNKKILEQTRGNGLWLWKPYFIYKTLCLCNEGDIVFYCDSGSFFIRNVEHLIKSMKENEKIWVSDIPLLEVNFTKLRCLEKMKCNSDEFKYTNQIQGTFFMVVCCEESKQFVKKWLYLCQDYELISPESNSHNNEYIEYGFLSHREDQSILSLLCKIKKLDPHRDPSQKGKFQIAYYSPYYPFVKKHYADIYKPVVFLHKFSNVDIIGCLKIVAKMYYKKFKYRKITN